MFTLNAGYVSYPDEFVNLLGGKYILAGKLPYKDFFDHHLPFAWYLSAGFLSLSFGSFIVFRFIWALFMFLCLFFTGEYIRRENKEVFSWYRIFFIMYPVVSLYYWLHLYLADSLAALFTSMSLWLLISQTYGKKVNFRMLVIISFLVWALIFSSLSFLYMAGALYVWTGYLAIKNFGWKKLIQLIGISLIPYVLYAVYLLVTGSFKDFWIANFKYNTELYVSIPNYTMGRFLNPIKLLLTLIFNFLQPYIVQVTAVKNFDIYFPVATLTAFGTFMLLLVLSVEKIIIGGIFFLVLTLSAPRSDVTRIPETDYQAGVYLMIGFSAVLIALWRMQKIRFKDEFIELFRKAAGLILLVYLLFAGMFLFKNQYDKSFQRYAQILPSVYEIKDASTFVNEFIPSDQIYWMGPYEPHQLFYTPVSQLPGKYPTLLPQFREDEYFKSTFLEQFEKSDPAVIIYRHDASVFNTPADVFGEFFLDWMDSRYTTIDSLKKYTVQKSPTAFQIGGELYMRNDILDSMLAELESKGYIIKK